MNKLERAEGLSKVREILFSLYPDAKVINVDVNGDKIKVKPNEEYEIPLEMFEEDSNEE